MEEALWELRGCGSGVGSGVDSGSRSSEDSGSVVGQARFGMRPLSYQPPQAREVREEVTPLGLWPLGPGAFLPCPQDNATVFLR